jgi:serine/threonine-protein kinase
VRHENPIVVGTNPDALGIPFGKYHLLERLGRGGMAEVWKAKALGPMGYARKLVVKRILPELACDDEFVRMFVAEARLSASLNHRNIVQVYEFGDVGGEYYLAMEWVHGRDLNTLLRALKERDAAAPVELAAYVAREVCRALAYAHALTDEDGHPLRLIHRDVSPSNVMIGFDGSVKLLDFGIAKALALASENRTQVGVLKGKFGYMAPEQVDGDSAVDHRADLFVAGVVLWEMLTLRRLFKGGNDVQTIGLVRKAAALPPSTVNPAVPPELDAVCMRALARDRDERFADCAEMAEALDEVVHHAKFGAGGAARVMNMVFPNVPEPTQQLKLVPLVTTPGTTIDRTPSHRTATPTPVGELLAGGQTEIAGPHILGARTEIAALSPAPPTQPRLKRAVARLTEPTLRAWRERERRRIIVIAAAATLAVAGVIVGRGPAPATITPAAPPSGVVVAPLPDAPWLTAPAVVPLPSTPSARPAVAAAPSTVRIKLTTRPAGAEVILEGEATARGVTPLVLTLPRGNDVRRLVLTAPGYQRALAEVTPDVDSRLHFELERAATHAQRRRVPPPRKLQPTTVSDDDIDALFPQPANRRATTARGINDEAP